MARPTTICVAPGDGIGPEIMRAALGVFEAAGVNSHLAFQPVEMGEQVFARGDTRGMTGDAIKAVEASGVLFKGPMATPKGGGGKSINVTARKLWGAYANLRHFRTLSGVDTVFSRAGKNINFFVVRENIEDTYGGVERRISPDAAECKRIITAPGSDQVCRFAFETAKRLGITSVHCGHKANIMKITDGLFLERFYEAARAHPSITAGDVIVDALCMNMVVRPESFSMIVLPNLQGDIVSDLAAGLVGGLGFAPSANIGEQISIFEAVHGTAPDIAGKGIANPTSLLLSGVMMLRHIGLLRTAAVIENALLATLDDGVHTGDFGHPATPSVGTEAFAKAIISRLGSVPDEGAVAVPESESLAFRPPTRPPAPRLIRTAARCEMAEAGVDIYITTDRPVAALASDILAIAEPTPFGLTMMSSRGTQVWPTGSNYTEVVDYVRARFEAKPGQTVTQSQGISLTAKIAEKFTIAQVEWLRRYDGKNGFSLAQGQ